MQWLVDLIIETIGIPPVYIHRGDPGSFDFVKQQLTTDDAFHEFDLSSVIPEGASAVDLYLLIRSPQVSKTISFRKVGNVRTYNEATGITIIADLLHTYNLTIPLDADRKIEYQASDVVWTTISGVVKGWWL